VIEGSSMLVVVDSGCMFDHVNLYDDAQHNK